MAAFIPELVAWGANQRWYNGAATMYGLELVLKSL